MSDINKIMNKYMEPINEGIVGDVVKGIKSAAHDAVVRVREIVTQAAIENMGVKQLEAKIAEWEEYVKNLKIKYDADKKAGKDTSDHNKNYRAAISSLSMMKSQLSVAKAEERKRNPSKKEEEPDDTSYRLTADEKKKLAASRRARPSVKLKTKLTGTEAHKERVYNSKLSKQIRAHRATKGKSE